jgi:hypothetical protein
MEVNGTSMNFIVHKRGELVPFEPNAKGVHANAAIRVDLVLQNTGLVDKTGGSAVFYQSQVKLLKV